MKIKKKITRFFGIALLCGVVVTPQFNVSAKNNDNQEMHMGTASGYITGSLDNNTPIYKPEFATFSNEVVPEKFPENMTEFKSKYPSLRDQGSYGACWAFSSIGLAEFDLINDKTKDSSIDLSELQLAYFTYNSVVDPLGGTKGDYTKYHAENSPYNYLNAGGNYEWAMKRLSQWVGAVNESDVPYDNALDSLSYGLDDKYAYNYDVAHLNNAYEINIKEQPEDVKKQIMEHGAVGVSYVHKSAGANYINKSYYDTKDTAVGYSDGGHAVMIVGWDDNYSKDNFTGDTKPENNGAWLVRNSWGESGTYYNVLDYFWMSYETYSLNSTAWTFDFSSEDGFDNNYQLDGGLESDIDIYYNKVANIFNVSNKDNVESETLKAVSLLFSKTADVEYTIDIYTDMTDPSNPLSGTRSSGASGKTTYAGYYTIALDNEVKLKPGSTFAVVVETDKKAMEYEFTWSTQDTKDSPIIWERKVSDNFYVDKASYYYSSGRFSVSPFNNYCIKAFTSDNYYGEPEPEPDKKNGLQKAEDGNYYYYIDDVVASDFSGLVDYENEKVYVKNGKLDLTFTDIVEDGGDKVYVENGKVNKEYNDLFNSPTYGWTKVADGKVDAVYNDLFFSPTCGWWKVKNGTVDFDYNDLYFSETCGWWKVKNGTVDFDYNDLYFSETCGWWKVKNGTVEFDYNDLYFSETCGWWKVKNGTVDFDYNDLYDSETCGWWKVKNGTVDFDYNDLYDSETCGWWKVKNGTVDFGYSGIYNSPQYGNWKIDGGRVDFN